MKSDYHGILNVGTGKAYSFNQVIEMLNKKIGQAVEPKYVKNPIKNYVPCTRAETSMAVKAIGFKTQTTLNKGMDALLGYYL